MPKIKLSGTSFINTLHIRHFQLIIVQFGGKVTAQNDKETFLTSTTKIDFILRHKSANVVEEKMSKTKIRHVNLYL